MMVEAPLDLLKAVHKYEIHFKAWAEDSFRETLIKLENNTRYEFLIDISRSGLISKSGESQRIGLCYPIGSNPGDHILVLKSGQEKDIVFSSRCLDKEGKPPKDGTEYVLIPELFSDYVANLLKQGSGQDLIWDTIANRGNVMRVRPAIPAMVDKF